MQEKYGIVSNYTGIFVFQVILAFYVDILIWELGFPWLSP